MFSEAKNMTPKERKEAKEALQIVEDSMLQLDKAFIILWAIVYKKRRGRR